MYETVTSFPRNYLRDLRVFQIRLSNFWRINFPHVRPLSSHTLFLLSADTGYQNPPASSAKTSVLVGLVSYPALPPALRVRESRLLSGSDLRKGSVTMGREEMAICCPTRIDIKIYWTDRSLDPRSECPKGCISGNLVIGREGDVWVEIVFTTLSKGLVITAKKHAQPGAVRFPGSAKQTRARIQRQSG
ncbi:hypothetical protein BJV78DRAFT_1156965 [Lactifluus subvellereus]|nr:hypothetical protein BJV78DRAFT_1156965 [Lactifluus subvellereus]